MAFVPQLPAIPARSRAPGRGLVEKAGHDTSAPFSGAFFHQAGRSTGNAPRAFRHASGHFVWR